MLQRGHTIRVPGCRRSSRRISAGLCAGLLISSCLAAAPSPQKQAAADANTAVIGFAGPLSDLNVQSARQGAELAVEEANQQRPANGRKPMRFILSPQDDRADPNMAAYVARYLVRLPVAGVIGHWTTGPSMAVAKTYEKAGIAQINFTSTGSQFTKQGYQTTFRILGSTNNAGAYLAEAAANILHGERIAVVGNDTAYSKAMADSFAMELSSWSKSVIARSVVSSKTSDFNAALRAVAEQHADVLFFAANTSQIEPFIQAVLRTKIKAKILLTGGAINLRLPDDSDSSLYALEPDIPQEQCPYWKSFAQKYTTRFGRPPSSFSRYAYNATGMLIQAVRQADSSDPAKVTQALHQVRHIGLSGEIAFDQAGNSVNPTYTLYRAEQPGWQPLKFFSADKAMSTRCARMPAEAGETPAKANKKG